MKDHYDFSNAERGKFYREDATLKDRKPTAVFLGKFIEGRRATFSVSKFDGRLRPFSSLSLIYDDYLEATTRLTQGAVENSRGVSTSAVKSSTV